MAGGAAADRATAWLACAEALRPVTREPATELLTLVWGPRFDRDHALALLARLPRRDGALAGAMQALAEHFDSLAPPDQQALRRHILRMHDNAACRESC